MNLVKTSKPIAISVLILGVLIAIVVFRSYPASVQATNTDTKKPIPKIIQQQARSSIAQAKPKSKQTPNKNTVTDVNNAQIAQTEATVSDQDAPFTPDAEGTFKLSEKQAQVTDIRELRPTINVSSGDNELYFEPETEMDYKAIEVVIKLPNGKQIKQTFNGDEAVTITDQTLADGGYQWEAHVTPEIAPAVLKEMAAIREQGNFEAEQQFIADFRESGHLPSAQQVEANVQSGYFTIQDGAMVMPEAAEKTFVESAK